MSLMALQYQPLLEHQIRLLRIDDGPEEPLKCLVEVANLEDDPAYDALSYTWGDPDPEMYRVGDVSMLSWTINVNGRSKAVTANLYNALLRLRKWPTDSTALSRPPRQARIWIDALCINQDDPEEKAAQVKKMNAVFNNASMVIAWLGEKDAGTETALAVIDTLANVSTETYELHNNLSLEALPFGFGKEEWTHYALFLLRAWFHRAWVVQEVLLARKIVLVIGSTVIDTKVLQAAMRYTTDTNVWPKLRRIAQELTIPEKRGQIVPHLTLTVAGLTGRLQVEDFWIHPLWIPFFARGNGASDARDQVYAVYGAITTVAERTGKTVTLPDVNYDPSYLARDAYTAWAKCIIEHGDGAMVASLLSSIEEEPHRSLKDLPSWVPDQSVETLPLPLVALGTSLNLTVGWRAAGDSTNGKGFYCTPNSTSLFAPAARVDHVVAICQPFEQPGVLDWLAIVDFIRPFTGISTPYTSVLDAIGSAIFPEQHVVDNGVASHGAALVEWIFWRALSSNAGAQASIEAYTSLVACDVSGQILPRDPRDWEQMLRTLVNTPAARQRVATYPVRTLMKMVGRRLFRTSRNYVGVGISSVAVGDEVWILPLPAPFVLRRGQDDTLRLVGDSCVPGIMRGEALTWSGDDALEWTEVEIV